MSFVLRILHKIFMYELRNSRRLSQNSPKQRENKKRSNRASIIQLHIMETPG